MAQETVPQQAITYAWPVTNPLLDTANYLQYIAFKNKKVREINIYDENDVLKAQSFINEKFQVYRTLKNNHNDGSVSSEENYQYDEYGMISSVTSISYYSEKNVPANSNLSKQKTEYYENKDNKPFRKLEKENDSFIVTAEAVYENNRLSQIKIYDKNKPDNTWTCDAGYSGDTVSLCGTAWESRIFMMITVNDSIKIVGAGMPPQYTILKNKRIIFIGDDSAYTKYIYKENGLIDYSLVKFSDSPEIKKYYYRYNYYED